MNQLVGSYHLPEGRVDADGSRAGVTERWAVSRNRCRGTLFGSAGRKEDRT
jgi:hypothetical protein